MTVDESINEIEPYLKARQQEELMKQQRQIQEEIEALEKQKEKNTETRKSADEVANNWHEQSQIKEQLKALKEEPKKAKQERKLKSLAS